MPELFQTALAQTGYALLSPSQTQALCGVALATLDELTPSWSRLPPDTYLRDGGKYRYRRHSCFEFDAEPHSLATTAPRAHWQSTDYNALHGGIARWFEPIAPAVTASNAWQALLRSLALAFCELQQVARWYIEAHQFRIDTAHGIGRPTPEGAHRDGVDYVAVILIGRHNVKGGETRVFEARGSTGVRFTMHEPWSMLLLDDARVIHETTPLQSEDGSAVGWRDTLVLTFRANGFQAPSRV